MQKDNRFALEVLAIIGQIANAHFLPEVEAEPQCMTITVDRRIAGRLVAIGRNMSSTLNPTDQSRLRSLTEQLAAHYGNPDKPQPLATVQLDAEDLDIPDESIFSRDEPEKLRAIPMWGIWTKTGKTLAVRINGPFRCINQSGMQTCRDGYLALDADGYPYPIEREIFERTHANERGEQIAGQCILASENEPPAA